MNNKNIIIAGAIAVGLYLFSQTKTTAQKVAQRIRPPAPSTIRQRTARKIAQKIGKRVAQKVAPKRIGQPTTWLAFIAAKRKAAKRKAAIRKAAAQKIGKTIGKRVAQKVAPKRIGQPTTQIARIVAARKAAARKAAARKAAIRKAAVRKAAIRKAAAQKIGKKIGERVAQKIPQILKTRRAIALYAKRQRPQIQRPRPTKRQIPSRLFSGAEKSRIIPYSESSKHSYYGPRSHKLQNEGYMVEWQKRHYNSIEAYNDRKLQYVLSHPEYWKK